MDDTCVDISDTVNAFYDEDGFPYDESASLVETISFGKFVYEEYQI